MALMKRTEVKHYLKVDNEYHLIYSGVTALDDSRNPAVETEQYIMDSNASSSIDGYEPQWAITMRVDPDDPVTALIREIGRSLKTGADAETSLVEFDAWEMDINQSVPAKEYRVAVAVDYISNGEGGSKIEMSGTLHGQGDPVDGTFDIPTKTFTETVS